MARPTLVRIKANHNIRICQGVAYQVPTAVSAVARLTRLK